MNDPSQPDRADPVEVSQPSDWRPLPRRHFAFAVLAGLLGIALLLVASQTLVPPERSWAYSGGILCGLNSIALLVWNQFFKPSDESTKK
ncbi:MAG: hypothetical protein AAF989_17100 [Planctomycetota bacterium]